MDNVGNVKKKPVIRRLSDYKLASTLQNQVWQTLKSRISSQSLEISSVVDLGCGSGVNTFGLLDMFPDAQILGVDSDAPMMCYLNDQHEGCRFVVGDFGEWIAPGPVDMVVSSSALHWASDPEVALKCISGYLAEEGRVFLAIFGPKTYWEFQEICDVLVKGRVEIPAKHFLPLTDWERLFELDFEIVWRDTWEDLAIFDSTLDILRMMHKTQTQGRGLVHWAPGLLRAFDAAYHARFGGVRISHEIGFYELRLRPGRSRRISE